MTALGTAARLPGIELIEPGIEDAHAGRVTIGSCLVWIAMPKLTRAGLIGKNKAMPAIIDPELTLYRLLQREGGNAYGQYNALLRRLVSFEHALRLPHAR